MSPKPISDELVSTLTTLLAAGIRPDVIHLEGSKYETLKCEVMAADARCGVATHTTGDLFLRLGSGLVKVLKDADKCKTCGHELASANLPCGCPSHLGLMHAQSGCPKRSSLMRDLLR